VGREPVESHESIYVRGLFPGCAGNARVRHIDGALPAGKFSCRSFSVRAWNIKNMCVLATLLVFWMGTLAGPRQPPTSDSRCVPTTTPLS
jgi:hypothetical protein